ncbi:hypothetical protein Chor_009656 [Crotalus horridus]
MGTKLSRLSHERAQQETQNRRPGNVIQKSVRNLDLEEGLEDLQERVRELEHLNQRLRSHLFFYKQQLQLQGCSRHCPYGHITAKVNTGFRRPHTSPRPGPKKSLKEKQNYISSFRSHSLVLAELDKDHELLNFTPDKEIDLEYIQPQKSYLNLQEYRAAIQKNVELIRLQKLLWEKNSELVISKAQITVLHENQEALRCASEALLAQLDDLNANLKEKTQKVPQKDNAPSLEDQLNSAMVEKGILEEQLKKEQAQNEALKQEVNSFQERLAILENQAPEEPPQSNATQVELEKVLTHSRQEKQEHEDQQKQMDQLLDLRNAHIHQLKEKLKDVAYGTRVVRLRPPDSDVDDEGVPSKVLKLQHGEKLFELHISGAILSAEAVQLLGDPELLTFCTYAFYDFETHCTPLAHGIRPHYNFTSQYVVQVDSFFMQYLQGATSRLDLHVASAVDHTILASCWLHFGQVLDSAEQVHCTAVLRGPKGEDYGLLEYGMRLHFPFKQLPRHQSQTYLSAGAGTQIVARPSWQPQGDRKTEGVSWNELCIQIKSCANLRSRWIGSQPSPYAVYQFFTFPDHDTPIIPSSNNPDFEDVKMFILQITPELHHYLLVESLWVYVFDDEQGEPGSYLGKAQIPLVSLAHGHSIKGDFDLMDPAGKPNGSIHLSLEWKVLYFAPEDVSYQAIQARSLKMQIAHEQNLCCNYFLPSYLPDGEEQEMSEAHTTESDEVVVGLPTLLGYPDLLDSDDIGLHSWPVADETIQQLYVEFHFPGVPLEETETAFSLRKPTSDQEIYFHFSKDPEGFQRQMLLSMLVAEDSEWNELLFIVVSEPLPGARGECEDVGFSSVDLREILLTGNDIFEQELQVLSSLDHTTKIGKLKVSVEAAAVLRAIYRAGEWLCGEDRKTE